MNRNECFKILNIDNNASIDEINKAYKKLALIHHPDKGGELEKFNKIKQAYEYLTKPNESPTNMFNANMFNTNMNNNEDLINIINMMNMNRGVFNSHRSQRSQRFPSAETVQTEIYTTIKNNKKKTIKKTTIYKNNGVIQQIIEEL